MKNITNYLLMLLGSLFISIGVYFFLISSKITLGGLAGLGTIINSLYPFISVGMLMFIINIIIFLIYFILIGNEFGSKTVICALLISSFVFILEIFFPVQQISENMITNCILGALFDATGSAILFNINASSGGIDVIAKIINKFSGIKIGTALTLSNLIIVFSSFFVFGIYIGIFSLIARLIHGFTVNKAILTFNFFREGNNPNLNIQKLDAA